jgi:aspartate ammonia-lyase
MNAKIKLIEYRLKRICSTGTDHFIDLKIAQVVDVTQGGASNSDLTHFRNELELIANNSLQCMIHSVDKAGKLRLAIRNIALDDNPEAKV